MASNLSEELFCSKISRRMQRQRKNPLRHPVTGLAAKGRLLCVLAMCLIWLLPAPLQAQGDYLIGREDILEIVVWGHDDLKRTTPVSLEGTISFPLIGEIRAAGLSTATLEKLIAAKLAEGYIVGPQVTVTVQEYKSQRVFVMGEVNKPGTYAVTRENSILYVLSQAGGPTKEAGEDLVIIRPGRPVDRAMTIEEAKKAREQIIQANLRDVLAGDKISSISIRDGDTIMISKMPSFFVMGEVMKPGKYNLERGTTILMAISIGGPTQEAGEELVIIRPGRPVDRAMSIEEAEKAREQIIQANLRDVLAGDKKSNITIRDGDTVVVSKMPYFFVMGEVKKPGKYSLERGTTVLMAISIGGGLTPLAASKRTKITREQKGQKVEIPTGMEALVMPGDTIVVPESFF